MVVGAVIHVKFEQENFASGLASYSVTHFSHSHYRRNLNNALVVFVQDGKTWKIKDIEII